MHSELKQAIHSAQLPSLPDLYLKLKSLIDTNNYGMSDVANIIIRDPAMSARLLKMVNSAWFGFQRQIDTVSQAVSIIGAQQIHDLVLASTMANSFAGMSNDVMNMQTFWEKSIRSAVIAKLLAQACDIKTTETFFLMGLLHDIGHLIIYKHAPLAAQQAKIKSEQSQLPLHLIEREILGFDYAQAGSTLMQNWQLPSIIQHTTRFHIEPELDKEDQLESSIIHIAHMMSLQTEKSTGDPLENSIAPLTLELTGLSLSKLQELYSEIDERYEQATGLMQIILEDAA